MPLIPFGDVNNIKFIPYCQYESINHEQVKLPKIPLSTIRLNRSYPLYYFLYIYWPLLLLFDFYL